MSGPATGAARSPDTPHAHAAVLRLQCARVNAHYLHEQLGYALAGFAFVSFVLARKLRTLLLDLPSVMLVHPTSTVPDWAPPKGAAEFIGLLAQLVMHWLIPSGPNAGEGYRGLYASNAQIAKALGISENQWRRPARYRDGKLVARPGTREWLSHHGLLVCLSTTKKRHRGWKSREGAAMPFSEDMLYYEPGPALLELLGIHRKRVRRNRRRIEGALKTRWRARSQPAPTAHAGAGPSTEIGTPPANGRESFTTKDSGDLSLRERSSSHRARARGRHVPEIRRLQIVSPVEQGVGGQTRRQEQNRNEPDGHEGPGCAEVGGDVKTPCQSAPVAQSEAIAPSGVTPPSPVADDPGARLEQIAPELAANIVRLQRKHEAFLRGEEVEPSPTATRDASSSRRILAEPLPGKSVGSVLKSFGDPEAWMGRLQRSAQASEESEREERAWRKRQKAARKERARQEREKAERPPPAEPTLETRGDPPVCAGDLLGIGGKRTPEERAENERQRALAIERARAETGDEEPAPDDNQDDHEGDNE